MKTNTVALKMYDINTEEFRDENKIMEVVSGVSDSNDFRIYDDCNYFISLKDILGLCVPIEDVYWTDCIEITTSFDKDYLEDEYLHANLKAICNEYNNSEDNVKPYILPLLKVGSDGFIKILILICKPWIESYEDRECEYAKVHYQFSGEDTGRNYVGCEGARSLRIQVNELDVLIKHYMDSDDIYILPDGHQVLYKGFRELMNSPLV